MRIHHQQIDSELIPNHSRRWVDTPDDSSKAGAVTKVSKTRDRGTIFCCLSAPSQADSDRFAALPFCMADEARQALGVSRGELIDGGTK